MISCKTPFIPLIRGRKELRIIGIRGRDRERNVGDYRTVEIMILKTAASKLIISKATISTKIIFFWEF